LWRLAEFEREDFNDPRWNRIVIAQLKIAEKKERWRKRKSDVDGLWDPLTPFFHPPEEDADHWGGIPIYSVTPPRLGPVIPALWTTRSTYPARIHVAPSPTKPQWIRPSKSWQFWPDFIERKRHLKPSMQLLERRSRPPYYVAGWRALWKKKLAPDDWRIKYQRERQEEFLLSTTEGGGVSINPKARETAMSSKFEEVITIKAPRGTRAALQELADRKYIAPGTLARQMLMKAIEDERRKETKAAA
jgi:hypothetical protein